VGGGLDLEKGDSGGELYTLYYLSKEILCIATNFRISLTVHYYEHNFFDGSLL